MERYYRPVRANTSTIVHQSDPVYGVAGLRQNLYGILSTNLVLYRGLAVKKKILPRCLKSLCPGTLVAGTSLNYRAGTSLNYYYYYLMKRRKIHQGPVQIINQMGGHRRRAMQSSVFACVFVGEWNRTSFLKPTVNTDNRREPLLRSGAGQRF